MLMKPKKSAVRGNLIAAEKTLVRTQHDTAKTRQALLLFIQEYRKEQKCFGFGHQLDRSVHLAMLKRTYEVLQQLNQVDIVIVKNGAIPHLEGAQYLPERGDGFNNRFLSALQDTFDLGYDRVVAIGGDIPTLHINDLRTAFSRDDLVVGPTRDGGFYLAALKAQDIQLFDQLPWRQSCLLKVLEERINNSGVDVCQLPLRRDIDRKTDARESIDLLMLLVKRLLSVAKESSPSPQSNKHQQLKRRPEHRLISLPPPATLYA